MAICLFMVTVTCENETQQGRLDSSGLCAFSPPPVRDKEAEHSDTFYIGPQPQSGRPTRGWCLLSVGTMTMDVTDLVRGASAGEAQAWETLVGRYSGLVWAIARNFRLRGGDASDVSQTTWLRLVENVHRLNDPARVGAWLATTARRECMRVLAQSNRQVLYGDEAAFDIIDATGSDMDLGLIAEEQAAELHRALDKLPERSQRLMRLLMLDPPPSYDETSAALDIPIGSIGPTRARCLAKLRILLAVESASMDASVRVAAGE